MAPAPARQPHPARIGRHRRRDRRQLDNELDAWENRRPPIASALLERHAPQAHAFLICNLTQTEGAPPSSPSAPFERWESLGKSKEKGGPDAEGDEARKILAKRGPSARYQHDIDAAHVIRGSCSFAYLEALAVISI
ncbi:hypothetical protein [Sorangium sp. So ce1335]|uniref:hypothetical protein n=1 Tax=Sorangium sp. So ce1335 TaxID=3133335 RepID=UPI003F601639